VTEEDMEEGCSGGYKKFCYIIRECTGLKQVEEQKFTGQQANTRLPGKWLMTSMCMCASAFK